MGISLSYRRYVALVDKDECKRVRHALVRLLSRREHSEHELHQKLGLKDFASEIIADELAKLQAMGLQSDRRYVEAVLREQSSRGKGPLYIRAYLQQKGVSNDDVQAAWCEIEVDWFALARTVRIKKQADVSNLEPKAKQRCYRYLAQRGFNREHIDYAMEGH